jgi:hypothetical protein
MDKLKNWWKNFAMYYDCERCGEPVLDKKAIIIQGGFPLCPRCNKVRVFDYDVPIS